MKEKKEKKEKKVIINTRVEKEDKDKFYAIAAKQGTDASKLINAYIQEVNEKGCVENVNKTAIVVETMLNLYNIASQVKGDEKIELLKHLEVLTCLL